VGLTPDQHVLRGIYVLRRCIHKTPTHELWEAETGDGTSILIKAWPFLGGSPAIVEQNLWDRELRILYRLASTPEAERRLVTLIDAAVDRTAEAFMLALRVPGFDRLSDVLSQRRQYGWLTRIDEPTKRAELWRGIQRLVEGLAHVHRLRAIHGAVSAENIFLDPERGPETLRLSGFEWSSRLGDIVRGGGATASALGRTNASLNADWYDLGRVLARLLGVSTPPSSGSSQDEGLRRALAADRRLSDDEKVFIRVLLDANGHGPLDRDDLERTCAEVIDSLERPAGLRETDALGLVVSLRTGGTPSELAVRIAEVDGEVVAMDDAALRRWIQADLEDASLIVQGEDDNPRYFLKGRCMPYRLQPFRKVGRGASAEETNWNLAFGTPADYINERLGTTRALPFPKLIRAYTVDKANQNYAEICRATKSWQSILPTRTADRAPPPQLAFLKHFLEVTNDVERAIRETEIYPVHRVRSWAEGPDEFAVMKERPRDTRHPLADRAHPMVRYLLEEDAQAAVGVEIYVGPEADLRIDRRVEPREYWTVHEFPPGTSLKLEPNEVLLRRPAGQGVNDDDAFLRTAGMFGQVTLLDRRSDGIDLLGTHLFLQRALALPDTVYMDTGVDEMPLQFPPAQVFDSTKADAMRLIWRTRPIFCLQGPPGTGKTTLVAQLLRQIFEDDPSCQVLLTAQARSAVDHLRDEVSKLVVERQAQDPKWIAPLDVRLRKPKPNETVNADPASPTFLAQQILLRSIAELESRDTRPAYIEDWLEYARWESRIAATSSFDDDRDGDFERLVRRAANFVYCTSTAGDLLELARSHQTFDWSIIEEAGKAHGFDLVLPLQTGHRWLLLASYR
jgi:serine/threonine protein kinase